MSRFNSFVHFTDAVVNDVVSILQSHGVTVDVLRHEYDGNVGFDTEVGDPVKIKRLLVHLSNATGSTKKSGDDALSGTPSEFIGVTTDTDVRIDDLWRHKSKVYRVVALNKSFDNLIQARLRVVE